MLEGPRAIGQPYRHDLRLRLRASLVLRTVQSLRQFAQPLFCHGTQQR